MELPTRGVKNLWWVPVGFRWETKTGHARFCFRAHRKPPGLTVCYLSLRNVTVAKRHIRDTLCCPSFCMICLNSCFLSYVSCFSFLLFYFGSCLLLARTYSCVLGLLPLSMLDWQLTDAVVQLPSGRSTVRVSVVRVVIL